ncbi:MAG: hypothetical protein DRI44_09045 [Chlamydiae bacterium]|nr:MAG: hypothetical protein DRI44_09045 [Chlamydiota bacterium]
MSKQEKKDKDKRIFFKVILAAVYSIISLLILWIIIPPIIANTSLITGPIERSLSKKFNAKVNVRKIRISNWTLTPKLRISSIDFYEKKTNIFLAFVDDVRMVLSPFSLLKGKIETKRINVSRVDVELPSLMIQHYLLNHKYIKKTFLDESSNKIDQFMSFVNGVITINESNSWSVINVKSDCELPFMSEAGISFNYSVNTDKEIIKINKFHASGIRTIRKLDFNNRKSAFYTLDLPIDLNFTGMIKRDNINIAPIILTLETSIINASYTKNSTGTFFNINATEQNFNRIERLFNTRTRNNKLVDVSFKLKSHAAPGKKMHTDCTVNVKRGIFRNVPFKDYLMSFNLINDKIISFDSTANAWSGKLHLNLLDKPGKGSTNNTLVGHLSATRADLNACLGGMSMMPARAGGEINFKINFDVDNMGIAQFIHNKLAQLEFNHGTGEICLSNAYLKYFTTERWQSTREIPKIVRRFLNLAANMTGAPLSLPILNKLIKQFEINKPRTVFAKLKITNGNLTAPEIRAETTIGTLLANGTCSDSGELNYSLEINLNEDIIKKYGNHPLLSMFLNNGTLELPVILTGTLEQPNIQLNLTPEQRELFEERLTNIVMEYVENKLIKKEDKAEISDKTMKSIKKTVKGLLKRFL